MYSPEIALNYFQLLDLTCLTRYKDEAAVDKHMNSEYFKELGAAIKDQNLLAKPLDIMKTKVIGGYDSKL